ncbi:MAG: anthranilate phosphoribosyltransferase [Pseudomonadales bacterium]
MNMQQAIAAVIDKRDLSTDEMASVMRLIMTGEATEAQIGGFLIGLRIKGETVDEITGAAQVMRDLVKRVDISGPHLVDTCGTGGDGASIFNVSTAGAFVVAAAQGQVAKHGNRSISSKSGSADVLEAAGINLDLTPEQVASCIEEIGLGFMFAPAHHSAMKHAIGPRKEMGVRTIFNVLGPLTNPALVKNQVLGVFSKDLVRPMAEVLQRLGSEHVLVVHSADGLDEISVADESYVAELKGGEIREYTVSPEEFGIERATLETLTAADAEASLDIIKRAFKTGVGPAADIIALNAGAALYASNIADTLKEGVLLAQDAIDSGLAREKMTELASHTRCLALKNI